MPKSKTYGEFVEKFNPKKTTDDCYTPPLVYEAVQQWALANMEGVEGLEVCRPFYPGGDFEAEDYTGKVVVDNPPFSILAKIKRFFPERDIPFFLFSPHLTLFSSEWRSVCHICTGVTITYDNGARVNTSFITNRIKGEAVMSAPDLFNAVKTANDEALKDKKAPELPKYVYPPQVLTSSRMNKLNDIDHPVVVRTSEVERIDKLDSQRAVGKGIFGYGFLLSDNATDRVCEAEAQREADRAQREAERAQREAERAQRGMCIEWELSARELGIVRNLSKDEE